MGDIVSGGEVHSAMRALVAVFTLVILQSFLLWESLMNLRRYQTVKDTQNVNAAIAVNEIRAFVSAADR